MGSQGTTGLKRLINAFFFSMKGLRAAYVNEAAFRQELSLAIILIPAALWLGNSGMEKAILITTVLLVLIVELLNSGIEAVVDRFGGEQHELSGRAKDVASAAVFVSLSNVIVVWCLVLFL